MSLVKTPAERAKSKHVKADPYAGLTYAQRKVAHAKAQAQATHDAQVRAFALARYYRPDIDLLYYAGA